jgi:hypothetical protein
MCKFADYHCCNMHPSDGVHIGTFMQISSHNVIYSLKNLLKKSFQRKRYAKVLWSERWARERRSGGGAKGWTR